MAGISIRAVEERDRPWVETFIAERWGSAIVVAHGEVYRAADLAGFIADLAEARAGLLTYALGAASCEIVTLDSLVERRGVGTALVDRAKQEATQRGCSRLWLITTNDNIEALRFYQKRGFELVALHRGAVAASRRLKPEIPMLGAHGIPIRDELELELRL